MNSSASRHRQGALAPRRFVQLERLLELLHGAGKVAAVVGELAAGEVAVGQILVVGVDALRPDAIGLLDQLVRAVDLSEVRESDAPGS